MDTQQLISGCIKKNAKAREELYNRYKNTLFSISLKYCASYVEAEDHLHDIFIEIFEKIKTYKGKGSFEGWMKRIAINKAIDRYKKKVNFESLQHHTPYTEEDIAIGAEASSLSFDSLMSCIHGLSPKYRIIFSLYELDAYSHKEIAAMLSITTGTSKSNLHRAKILLKKQILELVEGKSKNRRYGK
ncbi:RNA polymerase sigma factor [Spongiimicrobium salis]|uniref:RNA polymerase sigma factor n=1 Tax=Spongiimicrobium salis TaxID=1667022 RepID=UPI00374D7D5C